MIDGELFAQRMEQWKKDCLQDDDQYGADIITDVLLELSGIPTLTQPNEPLTCDGCACENDERERCNYCVRASYLSDHYFPLEKGENDGTD